MIQSYVQGIASLLKEHMFIEASGIQEVVSLQKKISQLLARKAWCCGNFQFSANPSTGGCGLEDASRATHFSASKKPSSYI
mmetsp:Transcript_28417/g.59354  ORF Transcript_28417/g.59354 Transcript_28417/m.59354 type:complete len:81 (+) Transcript_28417:236-478(+)